ncbi:hypothetical protein LguiA_027433 [Lonicera macranthoides]
MSVTGRGRVEWWRGLLNKGSLNKEEDKFHRQLHHFYAHFHPLDQHHHRSITSLYISIYVQPRVAKELIGRTFNLY